MRSNTGKNSGSSSGRPATLLMIWMPRAPSWLMARSISSSAARGLFIGSEGPNPGNRVGPLRHIAELLAQHGHAVLDVPQHAQARHALHHARLLRVLLH